MYHKWSRPRHTSYSNPPYDARVASDLAGGLDAPPAGSRRATNGRPAPGDRRALDAAEAILREWRCPSTTVDRLRSSGRTLRPLAALLEPADLGDRWLARFDLDDTIAALALVAADVGLAAEEALRRGLAGPGPSPVPACLLDRCQQFGLWSLRRRLLDHALAIRDPVRLADVLGWLERFRERHRPAVAELERRVEARVRQVAGVVRVRFEYRALSGASERLSRLGKTTAELDAGWEQFGTLTVVTATVSDCYRALEGVHATGLPEPEQLKDLVSAPNGNGYSGLCTRVSIDHGAGPGAPRGRLPVFRVAIQTELMQELSRLGIAHPAVRARIARRTEPAATAEERCVARLVDSLSDGTGDTITVFTARGEARQVPAGATALDLAYRIHTDVGNHAVGAEVNGKRTSLGAALSPGARVTVLVDRRGEGRTEDDLPLVAEARHRRRILAFINSQPLRKGRHAIATHLRQHGVSLEAAELDALAMDVAERHRYADAGALYRAVGEVERARAAGGRRSPAAGTAREPTAGWVAAQIRRLRREQVPGAAHPMYVDPTTEWVPAVADDRYGGRGRRFKLCAICRPSRTAEIVGTERRGSITVHLPSCHRVSGRPVLPLRWEKVDRAVRARLAVLAWDRPRLLAEVLGPVYELGCGLTHVQAAVADGGRANLRLTLHLRSAGSLVQLVELLDHVTSVLGVSIEESSLPAPLLDRIRSGPRDQGLLDELATQGQGDPAGGPVLIAPSFAERRQTIRLPYTSNKPTHSPRSFVGRHTAARWLAQHTVEAAGGGVALVVGPARVGKTSLCLRFLDESPESVVPPHRVDLRDLWDQTTEQAFASLQARLRPLVGGPQDQPATAAGVVELVRRAVDELGGRHLVIVLDEFGGPLNGLWRGRLGEQFFDVIPQLMDLGLPLSLVLVAVPEAHELMHRSGVWDRLRTCRDHELGALEPDEARQMIVRPFTEQGVQWDEPALAHLVQLSGRLPLFIIFLLQEVAHRLNVDTRKRYVRVEDVRQAAGRLVRSESTFAYWLGRWRETPASRACLRALIRDGQRGAIDEDAWRRSARVDGAGTDEFDRAANRLVAAGVMTRDARRYSFAVPMFWSWVDRNLRSAARLRALGLDA
jgi:(p)ppGpp synthase/HD superfamily hydrolase